MSQVEACPCAPGTSGFSRVLHSLPLTGSGGLKHSDLSAFRTHCQKVTLPMGSHVVAFPISKWMASPHPHRRCCYDMMLIQHPWAWSRAPWCSLYDTTGRYFKVTCFSFLIYTSNFPSKFKLVPWVFLLYSQRPIFRGAIVSKTNGWSQVDAVIITWVCIMQTQFPLCHPLECDRWWQWRICCCIISQKFSFLFWNLTCLMYSLLVNLCALGNCSLAHMLMSTCYHQTQQSPLTQNGLQGN